MAATQKAIALARELKDTLSIRFGAVSLTVVDGFDASGFPTLLVSDGTQAAGEQAAFVRIKPVASINLDSLGLAQNVFTPHIIQVVLETSTIANVPLLTGANMLRLMGEVLKKGTKVELYLSANTNVPDVADITSGNLAFTWNDLYHPLTSSI